MPCRLLPPASLGRAPLPQPFPAQHSAHSRLVPAAAANGEAGKHKGRTETTFVTPASSSASLSISPSTTTMSAHPATSSSPNSTFSAPRTCSRRRGQGMVGGRAGVGGLGMGRAAAALAESRVLLALCPVQTV